MYIIIIEKNWIRKKNRGVSTLATMTALIAVENKIPSVSSLAKKADYDTKISELVKETYWS